MAQSRLDPPLHPTHHLMRRILVLLVALLSPLALQAQASAGKLDASLTTSHRVFANVTYSTGSGYESKMDVYASRASAPAPTLVYIHGGGWVGGTIAGSFLQAMPYLA